MTRLNGSGQLTADNGRRSPTRRHRTRARSLVGAGVGVLALGAAACGGGSSSSSSTTSSSTTSAGGSSGVLSSYQNTVAAQSSRLALNVGVVEPGQPQVNVTGTGVVSFGNNNAEFSLNIPGAGTLQYRVVGGTVYVMLPPQAAQSVTGGKPWASVNEANLDPGNTSSTGVGTTGSDPSQVLGYLQGISGSTTNLGTATIRGMQTTHYRVVVDLNKAAAQGGPRGAEYQRLASELHGTTLPIDVWLDSQNRVVQEAVHLAVPASRGQPGTANVNVLVQLYDFGTPVNVVAPPANEVAPLTVPSTTTTAP